MSKRKTRRRKKNIPIKNFIKEYSKYIHEHQKEFKFFKKLYKKDRELFDKIVMDSRKLNIIENSKNVEIIEAESFLMPKIIDNKYVNYFLEDGLLNLFNNMAIKNLNNFNDLVKDKITDYIGFVPTINKQNMEAKIKEQDYLTGMIHSRDIDRSIAFGIIRNYSENDKMYITVIASNGDDVLFFSPTDHSIEDYEKGPKEIKNIMYSIINLFYYINCYPDKILNRPPYEILNKKNKNNSFSVKQSNEIKEYLSNDITPHLRRGHFRYLGSDYFKNKKGQTVFVNPAFIGGKVKTIIE